jgi:putative acetyltransferase
MYLLPEARGRGLGRALLARVLAHARTQGARRVVLDTVEEMRHAIDFYERNGFRRDDTQIRGCRCTRGYVLEL